MSSEDDSDEVYDEIDRFLMSRDGVEDESDQDIRYQKKRDEEVLNVEGETSEDDDLDVSDDDDDSGDLFDSESDHGKQDVEKLLPSADKWGRGRKSFYSTSYVDEDWGGMNDNEIELAELEEEDATIRQRKLDAALNYARFDLQDSEKYDEMVQSDVRDLSKLTETEKLALFHHENPELKSMESEYNEKQGILINDLMPLLAVADKLKEVKQGTVLEKQLRLVTGVFARYIMNILFFIHLKVTSDLEDKTSKILIDNHPVLDAIIDLKEKVAIAEVFLKKNASFLKKLRTVKDIDVENLAVVVENSKQNQKKVGKKDKLTKDAKKQIKNVVEEIVDEDMDMEVEEAEKRFITADIEKNKGLATKRKKGTQHSRVKKRKQYKKALIKKRSQKADVKKELVPYGGELRGIRASAVKSIKLKA